MATLPRNLGLIREIALLFLAQEEQRGSVYVTGPGGTFERTRGMLDFANPEHAANRCGISHDFAKLYDNVQVLRCHTRMYKLPGLARYWHREQNLHCSFPHFVCLIDGEIVLDLTHRQVDKNGPHPGIFSAEEYLADWDSVVIQAKPGCLPGDTLPSFSAYLTRPSGPPRKSSYYRPFKDKQSYDAHDIMVALEINRSTFDRWVAHGHPGAGLFPQPCGLRGRAKLWAGDQLSDWVVEKRWQEAAQRA